MHPKIILMTTLLQPAYQNLRVRVDKSVSAYLDRYFLVQSSIKDKLTFGSVGLLGDQLSTRIN